MEPTLVVAKALDQLLRRLRKGADEFLEDAATWWVKRVDASRARKPRDRDASDPAQRDIPLDASEARKCERLELLLEIMHLNARHVRRDAPTARPVFEEIERKVKRLMLLRREHLAPVPGIGARKIKYREHPTILAEYAIACEHAARHPKAAQLFRKAIELREGSDEPISVRDTVIDLVHLARCCSALDDQGAAQKCVDEAVSLARSLDPALEEASRDSNSSHPALPFLPSAGLAYFGAMDFCLHHPDWNARDSRPRGEFNYYLQESRVAFDAPRGWTIPLKLTILSDARWADRMSDYVRGAAESLFVDMGSGKLAKTLRRVRVFWWGILDRSGGAERLLKTASPAAAVLVAIALAWMDLQPRAPRQEMTVRQAVVAAGKSFPAGERALLTQALEELTSQRGEASADRPTMAGDPGKGPGPALAQVLETPLHDAAAVLPTLDLDAPWGFAMFRSEGRDIRGV